MGFIIAYAYDHRVEDAFSIKFSLREINKLKNVGVSDQAN